MSQHQHKLGFDLNKYDAWFQAQAAGEYVPTKIVNRREMADFLDISTQTIDDLIHKGAPVLNRGNRGIPVQIDAPPFIEFYMAHKAGMTLEQYREWELNELRASEEQTQIEALRRENAELRQQLQALRQQLAK